jgi:hypothetical protein
MAQHPTVTPEYEEKLPGLQFALRALWIAVRLVLVLYLGQSGALFFYQGF